MRIRWKLLLLFLAISLLPMAIMRLVTQRSMTEMGRALGERSREELVLRNGSELARLVEDHARILAKERQLMESMTRVLALEASRRLSAPPPDKPGDILVAESLPGMPMGEGMPEGQSMPMDPRFCRLEEQAGPCVPLEVDFSRPAVRFSSRGEPTRAERASAARLAALAPVLDRAARELPNAIIWQLTMLADGVMSIHPAIGGLPAGWDPRRSEWYLQAIQAGEPVWTGPVTDPVTRQATLVVSTAIPGAGGRPAGVAAMVVPSASLVHENEHIRAISEHVTSVVVRPADGLDPEKGLEILAGEDDQPMLGQMHVIWLDRQPKYIGSPDTEAFRALVEDMRAMRPGVRVLSFEGRESLWAHGPIGPRSSLLLIAPMADVTAPAAEAERFVLERVRSQLRLTGWMLAASAMAVALASLLLSGRFTRDLHKLVAATRRLGRGDFGARVDIRSRDEVREVGDAFNEMIPALEERLAIKEALDLAREIQQSLLPAEPPAIPGLDVAGTSRYCDETGGDYYDFLEDCCGRGRLAVCVGDVSGHGIPAALLMASARAFLRSQSGRAPSPAAALSEINRLLYQDTYGTGHFMTLLLMEFDESGVTWARAGHDPALVYDPEADSFEELSGPGLALGLAPEHAYADQRREGLTPGLVFCLATDGVWEARNAAGEPYGKERLRACIREHAARPAAEVVEAVAGDVAAFRGGCPGEDDVTLVVVRVRG